VSAPGTLPDERLRDLLLSTRRIAVVGLSPKPHRDSNRVARYLLNQGYEIFPVYPRETLILGCPVYRRIQDIPGSVDLVDVFRRSEEVPGVLDDTLAAGAKALWLQLGVVDVPSAERAAVSGVTVVMNRCLMVEHQRLVGVDR
jgi:predicted CoA-binding protein